MDNGAHQYGFLLLNDYPNSLLRFYLKIYTMKQPSDTQTNASLFSRARAHCANLYGTLTGQTRKPTEQYLKSIQSPLDQFYSYMEKINQSDESLPSKKIQFLKQAKTHIDKLSTDDLKKLHNELNADRKRPQKDRKYFFIYAENPYKFIGFFKKNFGRTENPIGNTDTYKKLMAMMKERALSLIEYASEWHSDTIFTSESSVSSALEPLLCAQRGRFANHSARWSKGYEGQYRDITDQNSCCL